MPAPVPMPPSNAIRFTGEPVSFDEFQRITHPVDTNDRSLGECSQPPFRRTV
jgi:hypothetical protein